jgi:hypothetical protein
MPASSARGEGRGGPVGERNQQNSTRPAGGRAHQLGQQPARNDDDDDDAAGHSSFFLSLREFTAGLGPSILEKDHNGADISPITVAGGVQVSCLSCLTHVALLHDFRFLQEACFFCFHMTTVMKDY